MSKEASSSRTSTGRLRPPTAPACPSVQILQNNFDDMRRVIAARAFQYSADLGGGTGLMMKDYRGKNGENRSCCSS
jgi:hypothetical protein